MYPISDPTSDGSWLAGGETSPCKVIGFVKPPTLRLVGGILWRAKLLHLGTNHATMATETSDNSGIIELVLAVIGTQ
jgi:hypothetical protein